MKGTNYGLHPLIHTFLGFDLTQDMAVYQRGEKDPIGESCDLKPTAATPYRAAKHNNRGGNYNLASAICFGG
jgi:hypothetical protein